LGTRQSERFGLATCPKTIHAIHATAIIYKEAYFTSNLRKSYKQWRAVKILVGKPCVTNFLQNINYFLSFLELHRVYVYSQIITKPPEGLGVRLASAGPFLFARMNLA
jgi:hypothetical protein